MAKIKVENTAPRLIIGRGKTEAGKVAHRFMPGMNDVEEETLRAIYESGVAGKGLFSEQGGPLVVKEPKKKGAGS